MAGFYPNHGKRLFDFVAAAIGLLVLAPVIVLVALLVKLTSPGPAFYRQERVGRGGTIFRIAKFRSMHYQANINGSRGPQITSAGDPRITRVGCMLRRFKLDELPQLWNVLKGEMSLVGPRPEVACFVASYSALQRRVLTVRPGMTDPASLAYRREEELLATQPDPGRYYREVVLPDKLRMNLVYLEHISFFNDLSLVLRTSGSVLTTKWITRTQ